MQKHKLKIIYAGTTPDWGREVVWECQKPNCRQKIIVGNLQLRLMHEGKNVFVPPLVTLAWQDRIGKAMVCRGAAEAPSR